MLYLQTPVDLSSFPMADQEDYSRLPVEEKIVHKVWKVRLEGYTALIEQFDNSRDCNDSVFAPFNQRPESLKAIVTDSNVVAQETGILVLCKFLELGGTATNVLRLKAAGIINALCEKGLSSSRAGTKTKSVEALLSFVELFNSAEPVLEVVSPYYENRLPKLVAGCVNAVYQMVENFGCSVVPAKLVIPSLAKLFGHADRNVRAETTKLTVELYKWLGEGLTTLLFPNLKPVQQRDLTAEFEKVKGEKPEQKRLTRSQQQELATKQNEPEGAEDIEMADAKEDENVPFDPYLMMDPVEVLSKLPADLNARMASAKWKDRKEALDEVYEVLSKAPKLVEADYSDLVRIFAKCMKDANIQVVQLAANGVEFLSKGLKEGFHKYQHLVVGPMIERTKEKKPAVAEALANALDSIYENSSLGDVLDDILVGMKHKTPQVKISSTNYLQRCLASAKVPPKNVQIDSIMEIGVKLLSDSQEPIRQAATEMIGTLMKITSERELKAFLDKVDDNRKAKVHEAYEKAEVKCKATNVARASTASNSAKPSSRTVSLQGPTPSLKKRSEPPSIPSKRSATSPAKGGAANTKIASSVRSFTGRQLISPSTRGPQVPDAPVPTVGSAEREELEKLRKEVASLRAENEQLQKVQFSLTEEQLRLKQEAEQLRAQMEQSQKESVTSNLMVKQKDTQILRLNSDLENAKLKIKSLEQTVEMLKLQQSTLQTDPLLQSLDSERIPSYRSPERREIPRITLSELSSRVNRLSIDGKFGHEVPDLAPTSELASPTFRSPRNPASLHTTVERETGSEEENWKKAAEVTAQLKARIEKMKQRNRLSLNR